MEIKIPTKPFGNGVRIYRRARIDIQPGLTVFVGCNGAGKTTLLNFIKGYCEKENIPCFSYDNYNEGGKRTADRIMFEFSKGPEAFFETFGKSEGETITTNIGYCVSSLREFLSTGKKHTNRIGKALRKALGVDDSMITSNKRVLIFDGIDSGFSIDNVLEVKDVFHLIMDDAEKMGLELYILVSANSFEMAKDELCYDVIRGCGCAFSNYEDYREFVLGSRKLKDKRYKEV